MSGNVLKGKLTEDGKEVLGKGIVTMKFENDKYIFTSDKVNCTLDSKFNVVSVEEVKNLTSDRVCLKPVTEMGLVFKAVRNEPLLQGK